jgi:hypothetical protein
MKNNLSKVKRQNPDSVELNSVSWKPASRLGKLQVPEGFVGAWKENSPGNISRLKAEGWQVLDTTKYPDAANKDFENRTTDSNGLTTSVLQRNELVAMILPKELQIARTKYYENETKQRTSDILKNTDVKKIISAARVNPNIIESYAKEGVSVIE